MNQHVEYLGRRSFSLNNIDQTHTHIGPTALPGSLKWSAIHPNVGWIGFGDVSALCRNNVSPWWWRNDMSPWTAVRANAARPQPTQTTVVGSQLAQSAAE